MKLNFWFDLPAAILPLIENASDRKKYYTSVSLLSKSIRVITKSFLDFSESLSSLTKSEVVDRAVLRNELKDKVNKIQQEKTELLGQSVKLAGLLIRKLLEELEAELLSVKKVQRVKLVLKLVKLIGDKATESQKGSSGKQNEFFGT